MNLAETTKSREDNQLQNSQCTWQSRDFGTFLLLQVLLMQLSWNSCKTLLLLFISLFTYSQESVVLFLLLLCVVLVLYSYQESTLFVKALDPFNYNKTGCNQYQTWWFCCVFLISCMEWMELCFKTVTKFAYVSGEHRASHWCEHLHTELMQTFLVTL